MHPCEPPLYASHKPLRSSIEGRLDPPRDLIQAMNTEDEVQLEHVHFSAALEVLVTHVVAHVVELVLLEEIRRPRGVARVEETLRGGRGG